MKVFLIGLIIGGIIGVPLGLYLVGLTTYKDWLWFLR